MKVLNVLVLGLLVILSTIAAAKPGALIDMPGPKPQVAKSWKKMGGGAYEFTIDKSKDMTPNDVKKTLEKRMKSMKVKATVSGSKVKVSYTGDEQAFLKKLAKVKIRKSKGGTKIALESTLADGGIRADKGKRSLVAGEVRGTALANAKAGKVKVMVTDISAEAAKLGVTKRMTTIYPVGAVKRGAAVYFKPTAKEGSGWKVKDFANK